MEEEDAGPRATFQDLVESFDEKEALLASDDFWDKLTQSKTNAEEQNQNLDSHELHIVIRMRVLNHLFNIKFKGSFRRRTVLLPFI